MDRMTSAGRKSGLRCLRALTIKRADNVNFYSFWVLNNARGSPNHIALSICFRHEYATDPMSGNLASKQLPHIPLSAPATAPTQRFANR